MLKRLPRNYTLDELLNADPLGTLHSQLQKSNDKYIEANADGATASRTVQERWRSLIKTKTEEEKSALAKYDLATDEGISAIAAVAEVPEEQLRKAREFWAGLVFVQRQVADDETLIRSWRALKRKAGIKDIGEKDFPKTLERPMLVLYSANWCAPCRMMSPTFARLVPFFDKADVRYCHEDELQRSQVVKFVPQFVAYFPNGARVSSGVGSTTREIWDTMNKLIALGEGTTGDGELVCDQYSCAIVPKMKR